jgi:Holliday junction resolvasome RuvABC ATP-dependent DNA helicase subunit
MSSFEESHLELEEARNLFTKWESEFLRQLIADDMISQDGKTAFTEGFNVTFQLLLCELAASDGPINQQEVRVINHLLGMTEGLHYYNVLLNYERAKGHFIEGMSHCIDTLLRVSAREQYERGEYEWERDLLVKVIRKMAHLVMTADDKINELEFTKFSQITSIAQAKAVKLADDLHAQKELLIVPYYPELSVVKPQAVNQPVNKESKRSISGSMEELHSLIGLTNVKQEVERLVNLAKIFAIRKGKGLPIPDVSFHLIFSGNPGTGKTTVARIISSVYGQLGLLSKGHLVEVDRSGLVANYIGQTANKVKDVINKSLGGILFIDEAYSLVSSPSDMDFGREAIEILLKAMEDNRSNLVVIAAGYAGRMQTFLNSNPGLRSRFPHVVSFADYSPDELCAIFDREVKKARYEIDNRARELLSAEMRFRWQHRGDNFANAREVRNLFERVISMQANRISGSSVISDEMLNSIIEDDIRQALNIGAATHLG